MSKKHDQYHWMERWPADWRLMSARELPIRKLSDAYLHLATDVVTLAREDGKTVEMFTKDELALLRAAVESIRARRGHG